MLPSWLVLALAVPVRVFGAVDAPTSRVEFVGSRLHLSVGLDPSVDADGLDMSRMLGDVVAIALLQIESPSRSVGLNSWTASRRVSSASRWPRRIPGPLGDESRVDRARRSGYQPIDCSRRRGPTASTPSRCPDRRATSPSAERPCIAARAAQAPPMPTARRRGPVG
jgi:hypothetical protein